jgi:CRP-like cAMP-binding protein
VALDQDVRRLAATRPFSLLPREALQLLAFSCERVSLKAGQTLFSAGEAADAAYFVLAGEIALERPVASRKVGPDCVIGETALATEMQRSALARATTDTTVLRVPREMFLRVLREFPEAAAKVHAESSRRVNILLSRLETVRDRAFKV